ncbi:MAG: phytanoyl-CoA dioxygenase family protein [Candidatus Sericytochromatia bacterium]
MTLSTSFPNFVDLLKHWGVHDNTLSSQARQQLHTQGYLLIPQVMSPTWLQSLRDAFEKAAERPQARKPQQGTRHVEGLLESAPESIGPLITHPLLLAASWELLQRPFHLASLHGREPLPGYGAQGLHADWGHQGDPRQVHLVNSLWILDEMQPDNGATRLLPASHYHRQLRHRHLLGADAIYPGECKLTAPAGSLLLFNGHLWHSGTRNTCHTRRRVIQCAYVGHEHTWLAKKTASKWELTHPK